MPDFTATDHDAYLRVVRNKLCGLCGEPLDYYMVFIGGPLSNANRAFLDAPMHLECAEYAVRTCPYLAMRMEGFVTRSHRAGSREMTPGLATARPDRFGLCVTRGFKLATRNGSVYLHADKPVRVEWYENGERVT